MLLSLFVLPCLLATNLAQENCVPLEAQPGHADCFPRLDAHYYQLRMQERQARRDAYIKRKLHGASPKVSR